MMPAVVLWFRVDKVDPKKSFGFFLLPDETQLFAHWGSRRGFSRTGNEPEFNLTFPESHICLTGPEADEAVERQQIEQIDWDNPAPDNFAY